MRIEYQKAEEDDRSYFENLSTLCYQRLVEAAFGEWDAKREAKQFAEKWQESRFHKLYFAGELVGGVWMEEHESYFQLREIMLEPAYRNRGIGTQVIERCIATAALAAKPLRLRVIYDNPAISLYKRLGFREYGRRESSKQILMERAN